MPLPAAGTRCRMWVPREIKGPALLHAPTRKSVACFGAVNVRSGKFVSRNAPWFSAETFEVFVKQLIRHRARGKHMALILDNAKRHSARSLAPLLRKYRKGLTLLRLPPYGSAAQYDRTTLEACAPARHAQSVLRDPGGLDPGGLHPVSPLAKTQCGVAEIMLHNLGRCV